MDQDHDTAATANINGSESGDMHMGFHGRVPRRVARARDGHGHVRRKSAPVLPTDLATTLASRWRTEQRTYAQQQSPIKSITIHHGR